MKRSTTGALWLTLLVLISSLVCARTIDLSPVEEPPSSQEQNAPTLPASPSASAGQEQPAPVVVATQAQQANPEQPEPNAPLDQAQPDLPEAMSGQGSMQKLFVSQAVSRQALCNDGTPAVYYLRRGVGEGSTRWIIHLQGGGFCYDQQSCQKRERQEPQLMTAAQTPTDRAGNGILSSSKLDNRLFSSANQVYVAYCSSDLWSGDRGASPDTDGLHFRGAAILRAVIEDLGNPAVTAPPNLASASDVLFSGSSAGGAGVLVHLDWLAGQLPQARVVGVDDAGWFVNFPPYSPDAAPVDIVTVAAYRYWHGSVDASCATAYPGSEGLCYLGSTVYPYLSTPLFVQIAQFDGPQLVSLGLDLPLDEKEKEYADQFAAAVRASLESVTAAFSPADRTHGLLVGEKYLDVRIDGLTLQDVLAAWLFNQEGPVKLIE